MNRFLALTFVASLSFGFAACGDDEPTPVDPNAPITELPNPMTDLCVGQEAEYAASQAKLTGVATGCAIGAGGLTVDSDDAAAMAKLQVDVANCVAADAGVTINPTCAVCTSQVVACAVANCLAVCADGGEDCDECRLTNGCDENLDACTGLDY